VSSTVLVKVERELESERAYQSDWYEDDASSSPDEEVVSSVPTIGSRSRFDTSEDRAEFDRLADELASATVGLGSLRAAAQQPAYGEILALGQKAIPFLLERVDDPTQGPLWMRLLGSLIGFPPMLKMETVADAAEAWRIWGRAFGHLAG
jgi:hypothetical protein